MQNDRKSSTRSKDSSEADRGHWAGRLDFVMSCLSYAVGLGNIWRFPYLCYRNGGAVFLVPFLIFMLLCGMPLYFAETAFGQFASLSPVTIWRISPLFKGVGYGMVIMSGMCCMYYNVIITWTVFYLVCSFLPVLPWSTCDNSWNTEACVGAEQGGRTGVNRTLNLTILGVGDELRSALNTSARLPTASVKQPRSASEEFWENRVLDITEGIDTPGGVRWELFAGLAFCWTLVFLCLIRGVKSSGRVVYVTATLPYVMLLILLLRGVTLPGAVDGILFYVIPRWHKLLDPQMWGEAAMQIFYSQGPCLGPLITLASYNHFHNDVYRDARILPIISSGTSILAGFVCFSIIGFMAHETGTSMDKVVTQGPGLVFVLYPEAVSRMPVSQLWSILFFVMLFLVGIGSQTTMFQVVTSCVFDEFAWCRERRMLVTALLCFLSFLLGIPYVTQGGVYVLQIMDWYSLAFSMMIFGFTEVVALSWFYGVARFYKDIELMIGYKPSQYWKVLWCFITPMSILFVFLFSVLSHTPVTYGSYKYPAWAVALGWLTALCSVIPLPINAAIQLPKVQGTFVQRIRKLIRPSELWGPAQEEDRQVYLASLHTTKTTKSDLDEIINGKKRNIYSGTKDENQRFV